MLASFGQLGAARDRPATLYTTAVALAEKLGWAKTYDAEYLALARLRGAMVVSTDQPFVRGAVRTGLVTDVPALFS